MRDATEKQRLHDELRSMLADLSIVADTVVGAALSTAGKRGALMEQRLDTQVDRIRVALDDGRPSIERTATLDVLHGVSTGWLRTDLPDEPPMPWDRQCLHWPLAFPEVFLDEIRSGFDAMVANPPFLGGKRISTANGHAYREHLVRSIAEGATGNADLVTYFLLRMSQVAGSVGTLATNTLSQGDTREVGLDRLTACAWTIHRAVKSEPWPNEANLEIAKAWLWEGKWNGVLHLNGSVVPIGITTALERGRRVTGTPHRLAANANQSFQGCILATTGFILDDAEAHALLDADDRNRLVVKPYLNGQDLNEDPRQEASRWAIDFADWSKERAEQFPAPFEELGHRVRDDVLARSGYPGWDRRWWQYWRPRVDLVATIRTLDRVLAIALTSKTVTPAFEPTNQVFSHAVGVFAYDDDGHFGVLTSAFHWWWAVTNASTMRTDLRYTPSDVFETFPQPEPQSGPSWDAITDAGHALNEFRTDLMIRTNLGLTKTYNRVHNPDEHDRDIVRLRELNVELDHAVRGAYGWNDLPLDHHHWETPQGMRLTVSPAAKDELLDRLLELNHERYAAGLNDKKGKSAGRAKRSVKPAGAGQETLL